jgi:hypothetical protein
VSGTLQTVRNFCHRWSGVLGACALVALTICFLGGRFTTVRFDQERIDVEVEPGRIHVHGLYHYRNASRLPALLTLSTPFPVDADHPAPEAFALAEAGEDGRAVRELSLRGPREEPRVRMLFGPRGGKWILLDYWQPARVAEGRYILTTTRTWGRPIAQASFRLLLPPGYSLNHSNYSLMIVPDSPSFIIYTFSRSNFYPDQDWKFSWQARQFTTNHSEGSAP